LHFECLAQELFDVYAWHLFLLFLQWCLVVPIQGGTVEHRETEAQFQHFLSRNWEELQAQHLLRAQAFVSLNAHVPFKFFFYFTPPSPHNNLVKA